MLALIALSIFFPLAVLAGPRFEVQSGTCDTGIGEGTNFDSNQVKVEGADGCSGCTLFGELDGGFYTGDPCYDCQGRLNFYHNGDWLNFYHENGEQAGVCAPVTGEFDVCAKWNYSCSYAKQWICEFWDANYQCNHS